MVAKHWQRTVTKNKIRDKTKIIIGLSEHFITSEKSYLFQSNAARPLFHSIIWNSINVSFFLFRFCWEDYPSTKEEKNVRVKWERTKQHWQSHLDFIYNHGVMLWLILPAWIWLDESENPANIFRIFRVSSGIILLSCYQHSRYGPIMV